MCACDVTNDKLKFINCKHTHTHTYAFTDDFIAFDQAGNLSKWQEIIPEEIVSQNFFRLT